MRVAEQSEDRVGQVHSKFQHATIHYTDNKACERLFESTNDCNDAAQS